MSQNDNNDLEISEILNTFSSEETKIIVENQITHPDFDALGGTGINQFDRYYTYYQSIMAENNDPDILQEVKDSFLEICDIFLNAIENKFAIALDDNWKDNNSNDIPKITSVLYSTFVMHLMTNMEDMLYSYIIANKANIYTTFEDTKLKKDASILSKKRNYSIEDAVILSDIYDICAWILDNLSVDDFFKYSDNQNIDIAVLKEMYDNLEFAGISEDDPETEVTFTDRLAGIYKSDISFKGILCNNLMGMLMNKFESTVTQKEDLMSMTTVDEDNN